jgi:mono/diheme cytochrome c family protein
VGAHEVAPTLLERCAGCHERGVAPPIPFGHPEELARQLALPAGSHGSLLDEIRFRLQPEAGAGRMPLVFNPPEQDRADLASYLMQLTTKRPP